MAELYELHLIVKGRVQGVGFRYFINRLACSLQVTGYVKNMFDGRVEILAYGDKITLENFFNRAIEGPSSANVKDYNVTWMEVEKKMYDDFKVTF